MSKLKKPAPKNRISKNEYERGEKCHQIPSVSYCYLTSNSSYNLDFFKKNLSSKKEYMVSIFEREIEIGLNNWLYWHNQNKNVGIETIPFTQLKFKPKGIEFSKDTKLIVFRAKIEQSSFRIIGFRDGKCPIFFVIGFDFDFSAYSHGS